MNFYIILKNVILWDCSVEYRKKKKKNQENIYNNKNYKS
jgi:hypothetical protein